MVVVLHQAVPKSKGAIPDIAVTGISVPGKVHTYIALVEKTLDTQRTMVPRADHRFEVTQRPGPKDTSVPGDSPLGSLELKCSIDFVLLHRLPASSIPRHIFVADVVARK